MIRHSGMLARIFGLDLRSLGLFRVCLGLLILVDLAWRASDLEAHYTDLGILPRYAVADHLWRPLRFSFHFAVDGHAAVGALFLLQALIAVLFVLGFHTRLVTVLCWLLLVSLQNRNTLILNAGDTLFRLLLFWGMFLPLGARFSLDARRARTVNEHTSIVSAATVAYTLQICVVYWFSAALKTGPSWTDGTALFYVLNLDLLVKPAGLALRAVGALHAPLTHVVLHWQRLGPCLLFMPIYTHVFRLIAVSGFLCFHLGIYLMLDIGLFAPVCMVAWLPIIPGRLWEWAGARGHVEHVEHPGHDRRATPGTDTTAAGQHPAASRQRRLLLRRLQAAVVVGVLAYVAAWNIRTLDFARFAPYFPPQLNVVADLLRIDQKWNMFAPNPSRTDGWFVVPAILVNGDQVDLFTGGPLSWEKPPMVSDTIPNRRWGKYLERISTSKYEHRRAHYAAYLTHQWNTGHGPDRQLHAFDIYFVGERTLRTGPGQPQPQRLWTVGADPLAPRSWEPIEVR
jgi:hypothetical protein